MSTSRRLGHALARRPHRPRRRRWLRRASSPRASSPRASWLAQVQASRIAAYLDLGLTAHYSVVARRPFSLVVDIPQTIKNCSTNNKEQTKRLIIPTRIHFQWSHLGVPLLRKLLEQGLLHLLTTSWIAARYFGWLAIAWPFSDTHMAAWPFRSPVLPWDH